ncbi:MAG: PAS domain-containing protein [Phycisphaerales bacterium]|jgi:PAS domain S-box-containing protein|nr:PAS domain-containing protein [Phycisphaerales bacterium]
MKNQFIFNLIVSLLISCTIIAMVTGWYSWYAVSDLWNVQQKGILRQGQTTLRQLESALATFEKEIDEIGIPATRDLSQILDTYEIASTMSASELAELAADKGLDHIFIINRDGVVTNTTLESERNNNLREVCPGFTKLTSELYGRGQCLSTTARFSSTGSGLYKYFYYSPIGSSYLIETAIDVRAYISKEHGEMRFRELFMLPALNFEQAFQPVGSADFMGLSPDKTTGRSFRDFGKRVELPEGLYDSLRANRGTYTYTVGEKTILYHSRPVSPAPSSTTLSNANPVLLKLTLNNAAVEEYTSSLLLYLAIAICMTVMLSLMLLSPRLENIFRRISAINANLANIAQGNYTTHIDIGGEDEITTIAQNINLMGEEIARREANLVESQGQLYESEERLQFALDAAHLGTWDWVLQSDQVLFDSHIAEMLQLPQSPLTMRSILDHIHPEDRLELLRDMRDLIGNRKEYYSSEFRIRRACGHWLWVNGRGRIAEHVEGTPGRIVGTLQDIHQRKTSELERLEMETRLIQSQKMEAVGKLAGGISHDFNNLLQIIVGYTEMLQRDFEPEELPGIADEILQASERAMTLVRQLMTFSRSRDVMNQTAVNLNELVECIGRMAGRIMPETINFNTHTDASLPPVLADAGQIEQVLLNLCLNAKDAMEEGGQLKISLRELYLDTEGARLIPEAREGNYLEISVADTGHGMDDEVARRIFEPFFTTKDVGKGTGLGLATTYAIIRRHEGFIKVFSRENTGTVFHVYLPIHPDAKLAEPVTHQSSGESLRGKETILFAEDNDQIRRLASSILSKAGYTVLEATNGDHAVQLFQHHRDEIDLLLFDVIMPGKTGPQAADAIEKIRPGLPLIYASGYSDVHLSSDFGGTLIHKPYQKNALLKTLRSVLDAAGKA